MKKVHLFLFALVSVSAVFMSSCGSDNGDPSNTAQLAKVAGMSVSPKMKIFGAGHGDGGKALWVKCTGHSQKSYVAVNGKKCETTFYKDMLTSTLPAEYIGNNNIDLKVEIINEDANEKSPAFLLTVAMQKPAPAGIKIISHGYGDGGKGIWVTCENHTKNTKLFFGDKELRTYFYEDHITAAITNEMLDTKPHTVHLKDVKTGVKTDNFVVGVVKR